MRIFIGIKADTDLIKNVCLWKQKYIKSLPVRWISNKNLHLTVIPPWNINDAKEIYEMISNQKGLPNSFKISFYKISFGPNKNRPRLIWIEGNLSKEFIELTQFLEHNLSRNKLNKKPAPHITIARFNPKIFCSFTLKKLNEVVSWKLKVNSFQIFESTLLHTGAEYKILRDIHLS